MNPGPPGDRITPGATAPSHGSSSLSERSASTLDRVATWVGIELTAGQRDRLRRFATWLLDEALPTGGIGPSEGDRIMDRHVADALTFLKGVDVGEGSMRRGSLLDVGSGSGLPGIPLAIVCPDMSVTLLDRSGRRADLAARAVRVLGLDNVVVVQGDVCETPAGWDVVTMRAVLPLPQAIPMLRGLLAPLGVAVIGGSRDTGILPDVQEWGRGVNTIALPADVLDSPGWLLTIHL